MTLNSESFHFFIQLVYLFPSLPASLPFFSIKEEVEFSLTD